MYKFTVHPLPGCELISVEKQHLSLRLARFIHSNSASYPWRSRYITEQFLFFRLDNQLYIEVIFNQVAPDYLEGLLLVTEGDELPEGAVQDIARIAALLHRAANMQHTPTKYVIHSFWKLLKLDRALAKSVSIKRKTAIRHFSLVIWDQTTYWPSSPLYRLTNSSKACLNRAEVKACWPENGSLLEIRLVSTSRCCSLLFLRDEVKYLLPKPVLPMKDIKPPQWVESVQQHWPQALTATTTEAKVGST